MKNIFNYFYLLILICATGFVSITTAHASELNLAVANSTCSAIKKVGQIFAKRNDIAINYICKSSGRLAKGLNGRSIKADIYVSANRKWMDYMIKNGLVNAAKVTSPWGNELVVATRKDSQLKITDWTELSSEKVKAILIGDPGTAPFGRYAKQAMQSTGIWEKVKNKIETKKHITLLAETLAEADANTVGVLFASNVNEKHREIYSVNTSWHPSIRYYMAPIEKTVKNEKLDLLLRFIQGSEVREVFRSKGFKVDKQ